MAASQQVFSESNSSSGEAHRRKRHPSGHADTSLQMKLENITRMMESSPSLSSPVSSSMVRPIFSGKILYMPFIDDATNMVHGFQNREKLEDFGCFHG